MKKEIEELREQLNKISLELEEVKKELEGYRKWVKDIDIKTIKLDPINTTQTTNNISYHDIVKRIPAPVKDERKRYIKAFENFLISEGALEKYLKNSGFSEESFIFKYELNKYGAANEEDWLDIFYEKKDKEYWEELSSKLKKRVEQLRHVVKTEETMKYTHQDFCIDKFKKFLKTNHEYDEYRFLSNHSDLSFLKHEDPINFVNEVLKNLNNEEGPTYKKWIRLKNEWAIQWASSLPRIEKEYEE